MTLTELASADAVQEMIQSNANAVVTYSAHWCGPCKQAKPALEQMAAAYKADVETDVTFGIVYEDVLGQDIHKFKVQAFPTYVLYQQGTEVNRVQGANMRALKAMIDEAGCQGTAAAAAAGMTGGETLGGGAANALSPADARAARLAKLTANSPVPAAVAAPAPVPASPAAAAKEDTPDVEMEDVEQEPEMTDPAAKLNPEHVKTLTESMGFTLIKAQKGLLFGTGGTVEGAVDWVMQHQDDIDIDEPIPAVIAQSYKCNDCGKLLSSMGSLELHANKTGHADFEESTVAVTPLTAEEKAAKMLEIKDLLKAKRTEREEAEKVDEVARETQRRNMGKEMAKTKEQQDIAQRKRDSMLRKREKDAQVRERARIREEIAKDKAERRANNGKLGSRIGVDGYNPDGIQYDLEDDKEKEKPKPSVKKAPDASKLDNYIKTVSGYKAGGDGGKCLKILKAYVSNVVDNPSEDKYKTINMENKVFKGKVKPFIGAKNLLLAVGFKPTEGGDALVLDSEADLKVLALCKTKLEKAVEAY